MIIPTGRADQVMGAHLQKIYKTNPAGAVEGAGRSDMVTISKFAALVEHGRSCAMALPDVRHDRVAQARQALESGNLPGGSELASSMISRAVKGDV